MVHDVYTLCDRDINSHPIVIEQSFGIYSYRNHIHLWDHTLTFAMAEGPILCYSKRTHSMS